MTQKRWFKWVVEFQVDRVWVEDGFDLDDDRAHEMIHNSVFMSLGSEVKAKVLSAPEPFQIRKVQGYDQ